MKLIEKTTYFTIVLISTYSLSFASQQYEAGIVCPNSPSITEVKYLSAANDFDAQGQVREMLLNNTSYRGKQCSIKYLKNTSGNTAQQKNRRYEAGIVCEKTPNITDTKYFSASSDLEAENNVREILRNNTQYSNQRCGVKYLKTN